LVEEEGYVLFVLFQGSEEQIEEWVEVENHQFISIPYGRNFNDIYHIIRYPTLMIVDDQGQLVQFIEEAKAETLKEEVLGN